MEGLKEAIEFITNLKEGSMEPKVLEINGNTYCNKNLTRYHYFPKGFTLMDEEELHRASMIQR